MTASDTQACTSGQNSSGGGAGRRWRGRMSAARGRMIRLRALPFNTFTESQRELLNGSGSILELLLQDKEPFPFHGLSFLRPDTGLRETRRRHKSAAGQGQRTPCQNGFPMCRHACTGVAAAHGISPESRYPPADISDLNQVKSVGFTRFCSGKTMNLNNPLRS